jgi:predicted naringenin-chalcone synthase
MEVSRVHEQPEGVCLQKRMEMYDRIVTEVFEQFYRESKLPKHLIHVTCTGYISPSGAQKIAAKHEGETVVTHAYHMGCYASIPAIRMAPEVGVTDIVHTELCTLHINPSLHDTAQLVVQTLFADGFIKYSVKESGPGLKVVALHEALVPDSAHAMTWGCESWGLKMTLAKELPMLIARVLPAFLEKLASKAKITNWESALFAIHPGGPKIIEQVAKRLSLKPWQIEHSRKILQSYGNMSSATLPHIWDLILKDQNASNGSLVISLAFGPGLTICGGVFECGR